MRIKLLKDLEFIQTGKGLRTGMIFETVPMPQHWSYAQWAIDSLECPGVEIGVLISEAEIVRESLHDQIFGDTAEN